MKTVCIKTNNQIAIDYLSKKLQNIQLNNVYFSCHKFKIFNNLFIHYNGNNLKEFINVISNIFVSLIINIYEKNILQSILTHEYFYFDSSEKFKIVDIAQNTIDEDFEFAENRNKILFRIFDNFFRNNSKLYLKGFISFRLKKYFSFLEDLIDSSVSQYLLEKEYDEFISLLRIYVYQEKSKCEIVHLLYNDSPILLDKNKQIIKLDSNILNAKYLSDISFSTLDILLNTLLTILPQKIYIHLSNRMKDDFIITLENIFDDRIYICNDCDICNFNKYKLLKN